MSNHDEDLKQLDGVEALSEIEMNNIRRIYKSMDKVFIVYKKVDSAINSVLRKIEIDETTKPTELFKYLEFSSAINNGILSRILTHISEIHEVLKKYLN